MTAKKSHQLQVRLEPDTEKKFRDFAKTGGAGAAEYARRLIELAVEWAEAHGGLPSPPAITTSVHLKSIEAELDAWCKSGIPNKSQLNEDAATIDPKVAAAIRLLQSLPAATNQASHGTRR